MGKNSILHLRNKVRVITSGFRHRQPMIMVTGIRMVITQSQVKMEKPPFGPTKLTTPMEAIVFPKVTRMR